MSKNNSIKVNEARTNEKRLLEEYRILSENYMHEDKMLEERSKFIATLLTILLLATTAFLTSSLFQDKTIVLFLTILGIALCAVWWGIGKSTLYYLRLRILQAKEIEEKLGLSTYRTEWELCYDENKSAKTIGGKIIEPMENHLFMGWRVPQAMAIIFIIMWIAIAIYSIVYY